MKKITFHLKYTAFFFFAIIILAACGGGKSPEEQLKAKKAELAKLQNEIKELEAKIGKTSEEKPAKLIEAIPVKTTTFEHFIEVQGTVESDKNVLVLPEMPATIVSLKVKEGDRVSSGQVIATLDGAVFSKQLEELNTQLALATTIYEKRKRLWEQKIGSEIEYLQAKTQKEALENSIATLKQQMSKTVVTAPISGTIDEVYAKQGEMANPAMPIVRIINVADVQLVAEVSENYLPHIKKGDRVKVYFDALGKELEQQITFVGQTINPANRTFKIQIDLPNKDGQIKPNLVGIVKINDFRQNDAITVPTNVIQMGTDGSKFLYVVTEKDGKTIAKKVTIKTGMSYQGKTVILEGLSTDDKIITKGYNEVVDGDFVRLNA